MTSGYTSDIQDGITIQTFLDSSEAAVDAWATDLIHAIENAPPGGFRVLMDVSSSDVDFTRYARQKSHELFSRYRDHTGRLAFLFSGVTSPYFARIFFASLGRLRFALSYFSSREKALRWLHED
jgi:hypothetical protein